MIQKILKQIQQNKVLFVDLQFSDIWGKSQHIYLPASAVTTSLLTHGKMFDGSSFAGGKEIHQSDMILRPDLATAMMDPLATVSTLSLRCDIYDPLTQQAYPLDPRSLAKRAEHYLQTTGIADCAYFGPELEFFIFNEVRWQTRKEHTFYTIDGVHANQLDCQNLRSTICQTLEKMGLQVEAHHAEVACQNEITTTFRTLVRKADEVQTLKYVVHHFAQADGKTATFMPKPLAHVHGNGMHCHQSLFKQGLNLFQGDDYADLSTLALYYLGGIIKHAKALNAFTNPTTNSYKRLVPGFEAPVSLAYAAHNRSAAIRIPYASAQGKRIEVRFPDGTANPYFAFAALLMAGLDGVNQQISPAAPIEKNLYEPSALAGPMATSLDEALNALDQDRAFLKQGGVFSDELIDQYIALKKQEISQLEAFPHPREFELYYHL